MINMTNNKIRIREICSALHEQEMSLLLDELSLQEREMTQVIIDDLKQELHELGFELAPD